MAITDLNDILEPAEWARYQFEDHTALNRLVQSGVKVHDEQLQLKLASGGTQLNIPFFNDLDDTEADVPNDNPLTLATPGNITTSKDIAQIFFRTRSFGVADIVGPVMGEDPLGVIRRQLSPYWVRQDQKTLISLFKGILADNIANDGGDMVNTVGDDAALPILAAEKISPTAVIDTKQTMGDHADSLAMLVMHSVVFSSLQKLNAIEYRDITVPGSQATMRIPYYLDYEVLVDDGVLVEVGANRPMYYTYLLGRGSVAWAEGSEAHPLEFERNALQGRGGGTETVTTRRNFIQHVRGIKFTGSPTDVGPTNAEIEVAGAWDRVYDRKHIRFAVLKTNG